ncbi:MAG: TIGR02206 family membrane protein, partial [Deltaproteobacteria bacterium]|nr:TIGR02206 family membrane protein [Deltaproteobacteria bacterium]
TIALVAALVVRGSRKRAHLALVARRGLAALLLASGLVTLMVARWEGASWTELAPLHLCDAAVLVAAWSLMTLRPLASELTYYWSAGSLLALLTPDLSVGPAHATFHGYFIAHGSVVIAGVLLPLGLRWRPRPGAAYRAFLWTNAYAAVVLCVNLVFSTNILYLLGKPAAPTPLDWFGPWPLYLVVCEGIALALFWLMTQPFRVTLRGRRSSFVPGRSPKRGGVLEKGQRH